MRQWCQCIICRQWCQWVPVPVLQETAGFRSHPVPSLLTSVTLFTMMMMIKMVPFLPWWWWWWWWWHPVASPQPTAFISPPSIQTVRPSALAAATTSTTSTTTTMTTTTTITIYIACTINCSCTDTTVQLNVIINATQCTSFVHPNVMLCCNTFRVTVLNHWGGIVKLHLNVFSLLHLALMYHCIEVKANVAL